MRNFQLLKYNSYFIIFGVSVLIVLLSQNYGIFWDNILFVSKMGGHLYEHGFFKWGSLPIEIDPGHPPFLGTYLAIGWTLFNKSLVVSHWLMLPFIFGLLYQLYAFVSFFVKTEKARIFAFVLLLADPTLLAQLTLVNHEIIAVFFFFLALNGILTERSSQKVAGLAFLGIVSLRGMMLCAGIFLIDLCIQTLVNKKQLAHFFSRRTILEYLLGAIPALTFILFRLTVKGWIISNPENAFGSAWEFSSFMDFVNNFVRNFLSLGQQVTDFGRMIPIIFWLLTLFIYRKKQHSREIQSLLIITFMSTSVIYSLCLLIRSPMGHYYFLPSYLSMLLLAFMFLKEMRFKKIIYGSILVSLCIGNLIVYPDWFAQGWHSSLAHIPHWSLRRKAITYLDEQQIPISETASFSPNNTKIDNIDLNGDIRSFTDFTGNEKYVLYSNLYNVSDENYATLNQNYTRIKVFSERNARIEILEKND